MNKTLTDLLIEKSLITAKQGEALQNQTEEGLIQALLRQGIIDEIQLAMFIAEQLNLPYVNLSSKKTDKAVLALIPESLMRKHCVFPLFKIEKNLILAMLNPLDLQAIEEIEQYTSMRIEPVVVTLSDFNQHINKWFGTHSSIASLISSIEKKQGEESIELLEEGGIFRLKENHGPINKLAYLIISSALTERASDIHLEPRHDGLDVRFRLDGVLHKIWTLPQNLKHPLISSIKILAKMDIVEKRLPLDGSFRISNENKLIDIRVSSYPMLDGEKIVLRLLDQESSIFNLESLGMSYDMYTQLSRIIQKNYGIFLVTGPTGSGKTTTLYSILNHIKSIEKNIVTIEDPVEYHINLINQSEINPKCGLTFPSSLRSILRQDPDVILIGEIRDKETAEIAFQAALTGHLVFSTLHTNDAASSVARLINMGVEPYLLSSVLIGVLSQRLVRRTCKACEQPFTNDQSTLDWAGISSKLSLNKGEGCKLCRQTGYKGRTGIFEFLEIDDHLRSKINDEKYSEFDIRNHLNQAGFKTLKADALEKVKQSVTTLEEVMRVVQ